MLARVTRDVEDDRNGEEEKEMERVDILARGPYGTDALRMKYATQCSQLGIFHIASKRTEENPKN